MSNKFRINQIRLLNASYSITELKTAEKGTEIDNIQDQGVPIDLSCGYHFNKKEKDLRVTVRVTCDQPTLPFKFDVEMGGSFIFDSAPNAAALEKLAHINCAAVVYPYLREFVSELVNRGGDSPIYIPIVNFVALYKQNKK